MTPERNRATTAPRGFARAGLARAILAVMAIAPVAGVRAAGPVPELARLRSHVETLASPEFEGRRGEGGRRAAEYLVEAFRELGLEPLFDGAFVQPIPGRSEGEVVGRNVGAMLRGSDPGSADEWVIVSAHYDHLGVRGGVLYPGADDNATGVAMMLEVARALVESDARPRRGVMFVGFDLEEAGLVGSRHFVASPPVPLERVRLFLTADMIGRSLGGVCEPYLFAMGSENAPGLRPWIEEAAEGLPLKVAVVGSDLLFIDRSDYGPFRVRKVPYLFFSTGENPRYHTPGDTPETIDYAKFEAACRLIHGVVARAVAADAVPPWSDRADHPLSEAEAVRDVLRLLHENRGALGIGPVHAGWLEAQVRTLDAILERGVITPTERARMLRGVQLVLYSVLRSRGVREDAG